MMLVIGNKRYSSWSLRPWVLMKHFNIPFEEKLIPLDQPDSEENILKYSPSKKVPALVDADISVWESMAIMEYLNEKYPEKQLWPADAKKRAIARSVANEMHSGFSTMRNLMSHDLQKIVPGFDYSTAKDDVNRIMDIWRECLHKSGGPFLFGSFNIADAMYAPVVNRFITYDVKVDTDCAKYIIAMRELPAHKAWIDAGLVEKLEMPRYT
ncbi:glutathione S-transferase [Bdellovibrio sp. qaytius]|nr:glutathione S-transferase [Bdellovibrio sp. qaytius]